MELYQKSISQLFDLEKFLGKISPDQYTHQLPDLSQASLGQHVRHILEFHQCLSKADSGNPVVCYDQRERDHKIEQDINVALKTIKEIIEILELKKDDFSVFLKTLGEKGNEMKIETTFFRELWYVYEHTTHHMAILKIGAFLLGIPYLPENFGVADSTIAFRKSQNSEN
jgi:hypothetical protein